MNHTQSLIGHQGVQASYLAREFNERGWQMSITYKSALAMLARIGSELFEIQSRAEAARNGAAPVPFGRLEPPARR